MRLKDKRAPTGRDSLSWKTYIVIEVHEVGNDLDVGVINGRLAHDFLKDISKTGREDEDRHVVLMQAIEELLITLSVTKHTELIYPSLGWSKHVT